MPPSRRKRRFPLLLRVLVGLLVALVIGAGIITLMVAARTWGRPSASDTTVVYARSALGVPLHACAKCDAVSGRLPDGTPVHIVGRADGGRWVHVAHAGTSGWIVARYLTEPSSDGEAHRQTTRGRPLAAHSPWASPGACAQALAARRRAPPSNASARHIRVGTWNLHWFPDGDSGGPGHEATDVEWMACVIASMDLDVLVVQEVKQDVRGRRALLDLLAGLQRNTGHRWNDAFDDCPDDGRQHVGLLWDTERVAISDVETVAAINPAESACAYHLRPGIVARARFAGGLDVHLVGVHLDSGPGAHDYYDRLTSASRLADWVAALGPGVPVLVAGDFNTMGCTKCAPPIHARDEIIALDRQLERVGLTDLAVDPPCTEYYQGHGGWLDHVFVGAPLEPHAATTAHARGPCAALACAAPNATTHAAFTHLSDHCPVVVELR